VWRVAPRAYQKGLEFTATVDPTIPSALEGDGHRIRQVLVNLLGNAVKFTDRGAVSLEVVAVADVGDQLHLEFTVRDTGIGIAPESLERVFEPFEQGNLSPSRAAEGTGLGLGITRDLLELMGGSIHAESLEGLGSTFRVILPLAKTSFRFPSRRASDRAFPDVTGIVVSPHADTRSACVAALSGIGAHGLRAATAQEALGHMGALSSERRVHLIVDEALGTAALRELVRHAGAHDVRTTVLVAPDGSTPWQPEHGVVDHVTKPVARRELASRLLSATDPPRRPSPESRTHPGETEATPLVLVVDDLEINRTVLGRMLQRAGFRTEGLEFGEEVLPRLRQGGISAILLDLTLPDTDGLTVTRSIREIPEFRSLPIIALTGHVGPGVEADCLDAGCSAYLEKPVSRGLLLETLTSFRQEMPAT
jgi:CheY-like chemotaxis protein